jgi:acyl-CoA dehydrogenase
VNPSFLAPLGGFPLSDHGHDLVSIAAKIADDVAGPSAESVDTDGRFPIEAVQALQDSRLLGAYLPVELGGEGATLADIVAIGHVLGTRCGSAAMVFAMHQIQVACLVHHGLTTPSIRDFSARVAKDQLLLASATTETGVGGDVRTSRCAVEVHGKRVRLRKDTPVISYADQADAILVTARRHPEAPSGDQVICVVEKGAASLTKQSTWDTLGMRGTCSNAYLLDAEIDADMVLPVPYADISGRTMLPVSHLTWAGLWTGIASDALRRTRAYLRTQARKNPGTIPSAASDVAEVYGRMEATLSLMMLSLARYDALGPVADLESTPGPTFALHMNTLKTNVSRSVADIVRDCLYILGIAGFKNDTPYSVGRHLRDVHSAAIMVHNERVLDNSGALLCVVKEESVASSMR